MNKYIALYFFTLNTTLMALAQGNETSNIVLVTIDGFRWQEVFHGADSSLMDQEKNLKDPVGLRKHFWRDDLDNRRTALLPFIWGTIGVEGQLYGNRDYNNYVNVSNKQWFSYPGYNELLTGKADDARINSNDKNYNPTQNVLEFINNQASFHDKVAAYTSWDCFPYIINDRRSGIPVNSGLVPASGNHLTERELFLNRLMPVIPNPLGDVRLDAFTFYYGMEYLKKNHPRIFYFAFDETDDFAHGGEYGAYLNSAHNIDAFLLELWEYLRSDPFYKGKTTLILTVDHGRGITEETWRDHGIEIENADQIWLGILGPDTPAEGEIKIPGQIYQKQIAATLAGFLGLDFKGEAEIGQPVKSVMK